MAVKEKPVCKLVGTDGNVFALAARVRKALQKNCQLNEIKKFTDELKDCKSYDDALQLMMKYVEVE